MCVYFSIMLVHVHAHVLRDVIRIFRAKGAKIRMQFVERT